MEPNGKLKFHAINISNEHHAVSYDVQFKDEKGNIFEGYSSHFRFDLKFISALRPSIKNDEGAPI